MGQMIEENGKMRELVRVKSNNPGHAGYYTTYRDQMKPGDEEYQEPGQEIKSQTGERPDGADPGVQIDPGDPPAEPIAPAKGRKANKS